MLLKKILSYIFGIVGIILIPSPLGVSFCYLLSLQDTQCSPQIINLFLWLGLIFISASIILFIWSEVEYYVGRRKRRLTNLGE